VVDPGPAGIRQTPFLHSPLFAMNGQGVPDAEGGQSPFAPQAAPSAQSLVTHGHPPAVRHAPLLTQTWPFGHWPPPGAPGHEQWFEPLQNVAFGGQASSLQLVVPSGLQLGLVSGIHGPHVELSMEHSGLEMGQVYALLRQKSQWGVALPRVAPQNREHSTLCVHIEASPLVQTPPLQWNPARQSAWRVQLILQLVPSAHVSWLGQLVVAPVLATQALAPAVPLHTRLAKTDWLHWPLETFEFVQVLPHLVLTGRARHPPELLHPPARQFAVDAIHAGSSVPLGTPALQVPEPFKLQRWQVPHAATLQQTPFVQCALAHSVLVVHAWPSGRPMQLPMHTGRFAGQSLARQQWDVVPTPPPVQMSTHVPVAGSHFRFVPQVTPVQLSTQLPVAVSHFIPAPQVTPVQFATHMPVVVEHFCPAPQLTPVHRGTHNPVMVSHFCPMHVTPVHTGTQVPSVVEHFWPVMHVTPVHTGTHPPVVVEHFWPLLQATPMHRPTHNPELVSHRWPVAHITPVHTGTQVPSVVPHFWPAAHVTPVHTGTQLPSVVTHFIPAVQVTPMQLPTHVPVVIEHFCPPGQVTPVHSGTQVPVAEAHFCPAGHVTPAQLSTQVPLVASHFWPAAQVTPVHRRTQVPLAEAHFWPAAQVTPTQLSIHVPVAGAHFWPAAQVTLAQLAWHTPATHFWVAGQVTVAQAQVAPVQESTQAPATHLWLVGHTIPAHLSTHTPAAQRLSLSQVIPVQASTQAPATHFSLAPQVMPVHFSTHRPSMQVVPAAQVTFMQADTHWPLLQDSPAAHVTPVQLSTQTPSAQVMLVGQVIFRQAETHCPLLHDSPGAQVTPAQESPESLPTRGPSPPATPVSCPLPTWSGAAPSIIDRRSWIALCFVHADEKSGARQKTEKTSEKQGSLIDEANVMTEPPSVCFLRSSGKRTPTEPPQ
jgi:hypothetical protein